MKPYVICHMNASVAGRILGSRWRPTENGMPGLFDRLHEQLGGGSWLIGRVTGSASDGQPPSAGDALETFSMGIPVARFVAVH